MRIFNLLTLLIAISVFTVGCNSVPTPSSPSSFSTPSKGKKISDCMSNGGSPEACDKKYN